MAKSRALGQVVKGIGGVYTVKTDGGETVKCFARGKLRQSGSIFIGDYVEVVLDKEGIIEAIRPRKSSLVRPYVSNMDTLAIILAPIPKPDMLLVDKLIIGALEQDVDPVIVINKADLSGADDIADEVARDYREMAEIMVISTHSGQGIEAFCERVKGRYVCLAGQSAVGKSSLINAIFGEEKMRTGELSLKTDRGKNTTRHVEIMQTPDGTRIADTCGFNMLEMPVFDPTHLKSYYVDFDEYADACKYRKCCHDREEDCGIKKAVEEGKISAGRYERYLRLYRDTIKRWNRRYE